MNENELQSLIHSWENLNVIVCHISNHPEYLDMLVKIALDDNQSENYRAVWIVEKVHDLHPELVLPYFPVMTRFLMTTQNSGKKRHLLKLLSLHSIPEENIALLLDFSINIFTNTVEEIAVRVHAMQILFNIAQKEPGFTRELIGLIEHEMELHGSPGIRSRGRKLLRKLYAQK